MMHLIISTHIKKTSYEKYAYFMLPGIDLLKKTIKEYFGFMTGLILKNLFQS
jgi:hypothetical protein